MFEFLKNLFKSKSKQPKFGLGLAGPDPYDERDYPVTAILKEAAALPDQYIVPFYRHWFDDNFSPIHEEIKKMIKCQWGRGSCVSQSNAGQKATQEELLLSARFHHAHCKAVDNLPGEGTYLRTGQQVNVDNGICEESLHPEPGPEMSYQEYIRVDLIPENAKQNSVEHKSQSYWKVDRGFAVFQQALYQTETPIQTGSNWYESDNKTKGIWQTPTGKNVGGHAFDIIGWIRKDNQRVLVVVNSWGVEWGEHGLFYIPVSLMMRLYDGWITADMPKDVAKVIAKYAGKNIKIEGEPDIYFILEGQKHRYPDEMAWWSNSNLFAGGFVVATRDEVEIIPQGTDMAFNYSFKWNADQIKELLNLIATNSSRAHMLFKRYF